MKSIRSVALLGMALAACSDRPTTPLSPESEFSQSLDVEGGGRVGMVIVSSNEATGNALLVFPRSADGSLGAPSRHSTGGLGSGGGLGNQEAIVFARGGRLLYVVNAGSDEISAFRINGHAIDHLGNVPSGGDQPISLAVGRDLVYVLNDGASPNVQAFGISAGGELVAVPGSARPLSGAAVPDAAQIGVSANGTRVVVTEKATNLLVTYAVSRNGSLGSPVTQPSAGVTPFGFAFDRRGTLIVSEAFGGAANASVLSSYRPIEAGWRAISPLTATTETAACWVVVTPDGRFVYTTNTGSNSVSGYELGPNGSLALLDADGVTGTTGAGPIDMALSRNGRYLYTLDSGARGISGFLVGSDGSLQPLGTTPGLSTSATGMVAR